MDAGVVILAKVLCQRLVAAGHGEYLDVERRSGQRRRVLAQRLRSIAASRQQDRRRGRPQAEFEWHRPFVGELPERVLEAWMEWQPSFDETIGGHPAPPAKRHRGA